MPYEKSVFKRIVKDMVNDVKQMVTDDTLSISIQQNSHCDTYQKEMDNTNAKLWNYCVIYIGSINAILLMVFMYDIWKNYRIYYKSTSPVTTPKHNSNSNLVEFGSNHNFIEVPRTVGSFEVSNKKNDIEMIMTSDIPVSFCLYYCRNSGFVAEFIKTTEFIVLVAIFEYFFFVSIVDHFKIANSKTLLCDGLNA